MNMIERRMTPAPKSGRAAQQELRARLLEELEKHNRTTTQLAAILAVDQRSIQYPLRVLESEGRITGFTDRRNSPRNALSKVWMIKGEKNAAAPCPVHVPRAPASIFAALGIAP